MEQHDPLFTRLLEESRGIDGFFENLFSFFHRRTDFLTRPDAARNQLLSTFEKFANLSKLEKGGKRENTQPEGNDVAEFKRRQASLRKEPRIMELNDGDDKCSTVTPKNRKAAQCGEPDTSSLATGDIENNADGLATNSGNGYVTKQYSWTQTLDNVEILIPLPRSLKAKECDVEMDARRLKISVDSQVLLDFEFEEAIRTDESFWTVVDGRCLQVNAEKSGRIQGWWPRAFKGEPQIEASKFQPETSKLSDLDGETRQTVEKMLYDQRQKQLGLPTSEEQKHHDLMDKLKSLQKDHPSWDFSKAKLSM